MRDDRIEGKWIDAFAHVFGLCGVVKGTEVAIVSETQSRAINVHLAELALHALGARHFHLIVPSPPHRDRLPVRSTGASYALHDRPAVVAAAAAAELVVDLTIEGLLHTPALTAIKAGRARVLMISNEHPDALERLLPTPALRARVEEHLARLDGAREMRVTSPLGSNLAVDVTGTRHVRASWGYCDLPGQVAYWPAGLIVIFPRKDAVRGTLVLGPGDINLTFKRLFEREVVLHIEDDVVQSIEGDGTDAEALRSYLAAWNDPAAYGVSHVGWGLNPDARWESAFMYDKADTNGTELRAFAGNFLFSTGANEHAGRHTAAHFDFPLRRHSVLLDGVAVVRDGVVA
jgi:2,5-dihydroxypyridine 5,6-dioxygenase